MASTVAPTVEKASSCCAHSAQVLDDIAEQNNFVRVQATTHRQFERGRRFLEWLGFEREGVLRNYGPDGSDHIIYARIKNW